MVFKVSSAEYNFRMAWSTRAFVHCWVWFVFVALAQAQNLAVSDHYAAVSPRAVAIGDLDGDSKPDIVTGNGSGSVSVSIFWGNGDGTVQPRQDLPLPNPGGIVGANEATQVEIADLDGDSIPEILVCDSPRTIAIVTYSGNRQFSFHGWIGGNVLGETNGRFAIGDLNADSKPDIALVNTAARDGNSFIHVSLNQGSLNFATPAEYGLVPNPNSVAIGDLNADGKPDIVVTSAATHSASNFVGVFTGNGDGTFQSPVRYTALSGQDLGIADFNGDGKPDVLEISAGSANLLLNNSGALTLGTSTQIDSPASALVLADVNQDGNSDIIVAAGGGNVDVILSHGNGTLGAVERIPVLSGPTDVAAGDLNGDGRNDLAVADVNSNALTVILNNPGSGFPTQTTLAATPNPASFGSDVTLQVTVISNNGTPTGTVAFTIDSSPAGRVALNNGVAALVLTGVHSGTHTIRAVYEGNATFAPSSADSSFQMAQITTTTTLVVVPTNVTQGQNVQLTATVQATTGTPVGNVTFFDNNTAIATIPLNNGQAVFNTSVLAVGSHDLLAGYSGNGQDFGASSAHATVNVGSSFSLAASNPSPSFAAGSNATTTITLSGFNNFHEQVNFTCTAPANSVNCAFNPDSVLPANGTASTQLTITASPQLAQARPRLPWEMVVVALIGGVFVRRKQRAAVSLALALGLLTLGCAGGGGSPSSSHTPQLTTRSFQVIVVGTAATSGVQQTTTLNVTVTP
jgi:hypothetical protein